MGLTYTREDYIRAIYKSGGCKKATVHVVDLTAVLSLAKSTISERMKELLRDGYVEKEGGGYALTTKGLKVGASLTYKHRVIETFLLTILKVPEKYLHEEAHLLEHATSDRVIKSMMRALGNPSTDPHGQPIKKRT